jgi:hypothetical protein
MRTTRNPLAAEKAAQTDPAGPPPMTATSKSSIRFQFRGMRTGIKRFPQAIRME